LGTQITLGKKEGASAAQNGYMKSKSRKMQKSKAPVRNGSSCWGTLLRGRAKKKRESMKGDSLR